MAHKQNPAASPGYGAAYTHTARRVLHAGLRLTFFYPDCTVGAGIARDAGTGAFRLLVIARVGSIPVRAEYSTVIPAMSVPAGTVCPARQV